MIRSIFLKVKDRSGGVISVPIFASTNSELEKKVKLMDNIQITGKVKNYEGELELIPEGADSIKVIHSPPGDISDVNETKVGQTVKLRGNVREKTSVGQSGLLLELWGDGSSLKIYIPSSVTSSEEFPRIDEGDRIQLGGLVQTYKGELELKVSSSYNIETVGGSG